MDDSHFRYFCRMILDDDCGVRQFVYDEMVHIATINGWWRTQQFLRSAVDCTDGRWYLKRGGK